jgi:hypothetical protein
MGFELFRLERMATALCGQPVTVRWRDLSDKRAIGQAIITWPNLIIELDRSLAGERSDRLSDTVWHEIGHCYHRHSSPSDAAEIEADLFRAKASAALGRQLPWALISPDTGWRAEHDTLSRVAAFAAELRAVATSKKPAGATSKQPGGATGKKPAGATSKKPGGATSKKPAGATSYTRAILEAEYRSGALVRARQTQRGTVESMIARSLGLPNGEHDRVEWATVGGFVRTGA